MANTAAPLGSTSGAFAEDTEADARFLARKRYLAWRRRLLPPRLVMKLRQPRGQAPVAAPVRRYTRELAGECGMMCGSYSATRWDRAVGRAALKEICR